ncbi:hypothetical protein BVRB_018020 [Beta vulgaris subsp. vulgaris]|uniref:Uncharacterized protein n=1 Tax=Beta vulgaris subsp. vulgaris TaxID=3555 RepID=A0A0J7YNF2_BETVV|nr:hypothetical protein BVRB_018020 [Beta vulgaris subsp. vulgaris]
MALEFKKIMNLLVVFPSGGWAVFFLKLRWELLPFMKPRQKKGNKVEIWKWCCSRTSMLVSIQYQRRY